MRYSKLILIATLMIVTLLRAQERKSPEDNFIYENLYKTLKLQFEILVPDTASLDSFLVQLLNDAKASADSSQFKSAYEILETLIELSAENPPDGAPVISPAVKNTAIPVENKLSRYEWNLQIETGVDYSRQEFEMAFVESDSTLREELQNPFVSLYFSQKFNFSSMPLGLTHRFRWDNQFINYSLTGTLQNKSPTILSKIEINAEAFWDQKDNRSSFLDNQFRYFVGNSSGISNRWYLDTRARYKLFPSGDSADSDLISVFSNLYWEHYYTAYNSLSFTITPEYYRENRRLGQNYKQVSFRTGYGYRRKANRQIRVGVEVAYRDFTNIVNEEDYRNQYFSLNPELFGEWAWSGRLGNRFRVYYQKQNYRKANDITPDLEQVGFELIQKLYFNELKSFGVGYFQEKNLNSSNQNVFSDFVTQQNYDTKGLIITFDWLQLSGLFFNLEYRIKWDTYPNSVVSPFLPFYSNRLTNSISGFGWVPIGSNWQLQFFINYDNDHNRQIANSDSRNTILNLSLVYQF